MRSLKEFANEFPELSEPRVAKHLPVELRGLPEIVHKLNTAFKNSNLNTLQHDLKRPGEVNSKDIQDSGIAKMRPEDRSKIKVTGHKIYLTGDSIKEFLQDYFHGKDHFLRVKPIQKIELATSAHPELIKIILRQAIKDKLLPTNLKFEDQDKHGELCLKFPDENTEVRICTFRKKLISDPLSGAKRRTAFGGLEDDATVRGKNNALYYDLDKKNILDYGLGIYHLQSNPKKGKT